MSRTPYTVNVNRFICTELEMIRKMLETYDFSALPGVVERIQYHASSMEDALYEYKDKVSDVKNIVKTIEDEELMDKFEKILKR